jgi:hypothetical protein
LDETAFNRQVANFRSACADVIVPGKLLVIDESILNSHSKAASRLGMLKFVVGKPRPKGYFFHAALQKLVKSKTVFVLDLEIKWHHESPSMKDSMLMLACRCEIDFRTAFIILSDSGYPTTRLIEDQHCYLKSKFIASASISNLSGSLCCLVEVGIATLPKSHPVLLRRKSDGLLAFICKKPNYTQCLVTNAWSESAESLKKGDTTKLNFQQALTLCRSFSPSEMEVKLSFPKPSEDEIRYPYKYILRISGVDITSPLDSDGYVSTKSLMHFNVEETRQIAELQGINSVQLKKKEELVDAILKRHPRANHAEQLHGLQKKKKRASAPTDEASFKQLHYAYTHQSNRLLQKTSTPTFVQHYAENYGLQDRMNELIYGVFRH